MKPQKKHNNRGKKSTLFNPEENEKKRAERALKLAVRKLEDEGVTDYVIKVWRH